MCELTADAWREWAKKILGHYYDDYYYLEGKSHQATLTEAEEEAYIGYLRQLKEKDANGRH